MGPGLRSAKLPGRRLPRLSKVLLAPRLLSERGLTAAVQGGSRVSRPDPHYGISQGWAVGTGSSRSVGLRTGRQGQARLGGFVIPGVKPGLRPPRCRVRSGPQAYWELRGSVSVEPSRPAHFLTFPYAVPPEVLGRGERAAAGARQAAPQRRQVLRRDLRRNLARSGS